MKRMLMLVATLALAGATAAFAAEEAKEAIQPTAKVELFNGKDLTGWNIWLKDNAANTDTFKVEGGVIKCTGQPFGYIRTKEAYKNYVLTVEWRFVKEGNTGVFVHCSGPDKVWPKALECQGQHGNQGNFVAFDDVKFKEIKGKSTPRTAADNEKPVGEWNVYRIVCQGNTVRPFVNGKLMNTASELNISSGNICLQSEGGAWECRKVTLAPVQPAGKAKKAKKAKKAE